MKLTVRNKRGEVKMVAAAVDAATIVGVLPLTAIPDLPASKITSGTFDAARIPDLPASKITSGILDPAQIPNLTAAYIASGIFDAARIPGLPASQIASGEFDAARIPNLDASKIATGTLADARIPSLDAAKITTGILADARIPSLDAAKIATGTLADARIPSITSAKVSDFNAAVDARISGSSGGSTDMPGGRLTLSSTNPNPKPTDSLFGTTIYYLPWIHNKIPIWDSGSSKFVDRVIPDAGISISMSGISTEVGRINIFWAAWDGANVILERTFINPESYVITNVTNASPPVVTIGTHTLAVGMIVSFYAAGAGYSGNFRISAVTGTTITLVNLDGTNPAAPGAGITTGSINRHDIVADPGTAYAWKEGRRVRASDNTRTLLGWAKSVAGQVSDTPTKAHLLNYYNREPRQVFMLPSGSWTVAGLSAIQPANNHMGYRIEVLAGIDGVNQPDLRLNGMYVSSGAGSGQAQFALAQNVFSSFPNTAESAFFTATNANYSGPSIAFAEPINFTGFGYYQWIEQTLTAQSMVGYGGYTGGSYYLKNGISGVVDR